MPVKPPYLPYKPRNPYIMPAYNVILKVVREGQESFLKYRSVVKLGKLLEYVEGKGYQVKYINLYDAKTKQRIDGYAYGSGRESGR
jgi:hypothetical protein